MSFERGWLGTPAMTRLLNRLQPDVDAADEFAEEIREREIRQRNEDTYLRGINAWFRKTDEVSR